MTDSTADRPAADGTPQAEDQSAVEAFMAKPASYPEPPDRVERIDTHAAMVFLAGRYAYKVKRAVRYPFMDLSTLARREAVCRRELEINRRTAPDIYLEVIPITRGAAGELRFGGSGPVAEWVLRMRRFDQEALFDRLATAGRLTPQVMRDLADEIRDFHASAEISRKPPNVEELRRVLGSVIDSFRDSPDLFDAPAVADLSAQLEAALDSLAPLLRARQDGGLVRLCHGDLHLRNIVMIAGRPTLFDAVEFDDAIATCDLLYDLAFLLMDLEHRRLRPLANIVLNRYLGAAEDLSGLALLPLFLALRAAIRAMVAALELPTHAAAADRRKAAADAQTYFRQTAAFIAPPPARLVAVGGLSGSGKSSLAAALAPDLGRPPGALHLRSDVLRKQLFGVPETARLGAEAYRPEVSEQVYGRILERARGALAAGQAVIADAVYARPQERAAIEAVARDLGVSFAGLWLDAPAALLKARVGARFGDASDADAAVVARQLDYDLGEVRWQRLDAAPGPAQVAAAARLALDENA